MTQRRKVTHRISHHHGKLYEAQLAIAVLVCLHNRLVDDLLELCVLRGIVSTPKKKTPKARRKRTFKLLPTIILSTRNSSPLEMNPSRSISYTLKATTPTWGEHGADQKGTGTRGAWRGVHRSFSSRPPLLLNALKPPTNSWKSTVPPPLPCHKLEQTRHHRAGGRISNYALFVEYSDHPRRKRIVCDLRDLQKFIAVY